MNERVKEHRRYCRNGDTSELRSRNLFAVTVFITLSSKPSNYQTCAQLLVAGFHHSGEHADRLYGPVPSEGRHREQGAVREHQRDCFSCSQQQPQWRWWRGQICRASGRTELAKVPRSDEAIGSRYVNLAWSTMSSATSRRASSKAISQRTS